MLEVVSVCTPCCMLLRVAGTCCATFEIGQTFSYDQTLNNVRRCWPTMLRPFMLLKYRLLTKKKNAKALRRNLAQRSWRNISSIWFLIANQHCQALSANSQLVLRHRVLTRFTALLWSWYDQSQSQKNTFCWPINSEVKAKCRQSEQAFGRMRDSLRTQYTSRTKFPTIWTYSSLNFDYVVVFSRILLKYDFFHVFRDSQIFTCSAFSQTGYFRCEKRTYSDKWQHCKD